MSVSRWAYTPVVCDDEFCPGDCDHCGRPKYIATGLALKAGVCPRCKVNLIELRSDRRKKDLHCPACNFDFEVFMK